MKYGIFEFILKKIDWCRFFMQVVLDTSSCYT